MERRTSSGTRPRGQIVLLVEADVEVRMTLALLLAREGFAVLQAAEGREAIDVARRARPDAIVIDLSTPGRDNIEAVRRLKSDAATRRIPVIGLSGRTTPVSDVASLGLSGLLTKPWVPEVLLERLRAVLERAACRQGAG